jgi:hypothetical protein
VVRAPRNIRKRSEVIVERMVLHHHDNDVIDLAEPLGRGRRYPIRAGACGEGREHREEEAVVPVNRSNIAILINCHMSTRVNCPNSIGPASAITRHAACQTMPTTWSRTPPDVNRGHTGRLWYLGGSS